MVAILLGYFGTMVTVCAAAMFCLASVLDTATVHHARPEAHRMTAAARAMVAERVVAERVAAERMVTERMASSLSRQTEMPQLQVAAKVAAPAALPPETVVADESETRTAAKQAHKEKLFRLAREQRRRERLASRHPDPSYSATLAYAPESLTASQTRTAAEHIFNAIQSRR